MFPSRTRCSLLAVRGLDLRLEARLPHAEHLSQDELERASRQGGRGEMRRVLAGLAMKEECKRHRLRSEALHLARRGPASRMGAVQRLTAPRTAC